jgi:glutathione synthase/RimK-type ligase-like ATP-grasp enzyme
MMPHFVVIIAPETDAHAQVVAKRLEALDSQAIILDSALYPSQWRLTVGLSNNEPLDFTLEHDGIVLRKDEIAGVWWRRPRRYIAPDSVSESHFRQFIVSESSQAFQGWLHCLGNKVINPISADSIASYKILQLQSAAEVGLRIPKTLATNSPERVKPFCEANGNSTVFKPFTGTAWRFTGTQRLTEDAILHLDCVAYAPVIFQEEVKKIADIRVNIIDEEVFAITIRSKHRTPPLDWRMDPDCDHAPHKLPQEVESALRILIRKLGLRFGACDLALTQEGDYVFFEVNPGGQWLFAEITTGQELSWAFARALLKAPAKTILQGD